MSSVLKSMMVSLRQNCNAIMIFFAKLTLIPKEIKSHARIAIGQSGLI